MEPPASAPPRPRVEEEEAEIDFVEEEEDPELLEPWFTSSDSEPEQEPKRPKLEPAAPPPLTPSPALAWAEPPDQQPAPTTAAEAEKKGDGDESKDARPRRWPGWPGVSVFRLVVPPDRVPGLIGRRGETIKRLCDETRARVRVLDAPLGAANRIVLVSAKEEIEAEVSPAMNAAIKIFKHINEISEINSNGTLSASAPEICSARLLVPSTQALHLIGKQGVTIKAIQESTGATIRIIDEDELLSHETVDERIVEIRGASLKVLNALKSVLELLRKFLVDHGVLHLFERKNQEVVQPQDTSNNYPLAGNQDFLLSDQRNHGSPISSRLLYGHDPSFCGPHSPDICHATDSLMIQRSRGNPKDSRFLYGRDPFFHDPYSRDLSKPTDSLITKITRTVQVPMAYAEEIIGVRGENIEFIRSVSGAVVVLEEIGDYQEVQVMIEGAPSQVQTAHQLVQEVISGDIRASPYRSSYYSGERADPGLLNSPYAGSRSVHSPRAIATNRDEHVHRAPVRRREQLQEKVLQRRPISPSSSTGSESMYMNRNMAPNVPGEQLQEKVLRRQPIFPSSSAGSASVYMNRNMAPNVPGSISRSAMEPSSPVLNRDYLPWQYEEQTPHGHWRSPTHCVRGYRP